MDNRIEKLREYIDNNVLNKNEFMEKRTEYIHLYCVSNFCALIALKRKQNAELATIAGMLHDIYSYKNKDPKDHAKNGALLAKEILEFLKITNDEETELVCNAIYKHSDKQNKHSDFEEILIDADVIQHYLHNISLPIFEHETDRLMKLKEEFLIK